MVRIAVKNDLEDIVNLWQQMSSLHETYDKSFELKKDASNTFKPYAESIIKDKKKLSIVFDDGNVKGYLFAEIIFQPPVYLNEKIGMITEISVDASERRNGIGIQLLEYAEEWFKSQGIKNAYCQFASRNPLSSSFWKKNKYIEYSKICRKQL